MKQQLWTIVFILGAMIFLMKVVPLVFFKNKIQNKFLQSFLTYIPIAVLTSLTFPAVFHSTSSVLSATVGLAVAIILAYIGQGLLVVSVSAAVAVFIAEQIIRFMG